MPTAAPLVSIVIPSFNQGKFIAQTIESVLAQNYRPVEILVIDAGSTDNTLDILHKYDPVPEIIWTSESDNGHADGINKGFSKARGEIVAWLNSDDVYFSRSTISTVIKFFQKYPSVNVIYGDVAIISAESKLLRLFLLPPYSKKRIERGNFISQPAVFLRSRVVKSQKLDDSQLGLDYEYWMRLVMRGITFAHINVILAGDRHYPQRLSVVKRDLIDSQIEAVKVQFGFSKKYFWFLYLLDRFAQAICRIKGLMLIALLPFYWNKYKKNLAFPLKIDSFFKLFIRQLTKSIGSNM
jgi:glycosyltransferase involved in cell wall biosynthesis